MLKGRNHIPSLACHQSLESKDQPSQSLRKRGPSSHYRNNMVKHLMLQPILTQMYAHVFVLMTVILIQFNMAFCARTAAQETKASIDYSQCSSLSQKYRPEGSLGIRYKKQILQGRDMRAELHDSHMIESAIRKKHFLAMFGLQSQSMIEDDFQLQQLCPSAISHHEAAQLEIEETFCLQSQSQEELGQENNLYMSSLFYKPRYMHISQVNQKNNEGAALGGITIQQQGSDLKHEFPRDNSYLNLALNVRPSYELPIAVIDAMDQEQTIEGFLFKKAKHNNVDNFDLMRFILSDTEPKLASLEMYQRNSFTFEDPDIVASLTNGMRPNQIQKLKPQSSVYRFFTQEIEFNPQKITFNECQQLIPKFEILKITNKLRNKAIDIKTMVASTPEITFYLPDNKKMFPIRLRPQESIEIKVALIAETLGLFEGVIHALVDDWVYISTLNAYVVPNEYEISPFHVTDVLVNETFVMPLHITNPSATDTMIVEEMYSTDPMLQLRWPNSSSIISQSLDAAEEQVVKYILIPEGSRKHLSDIVFEINRTMDFFFELHLRTSLHDVIRVPIYYHVHSDVLKLTPTVVDFGLAPLNFDVLKIPIYARSKVSELLAIQEILLPLNDPRLDFQMVDGILRTPSTSNMVRKARELFLGYVVLNPTKSGVIESKIKLTLLGQRSNRTFHLDIPIIGLVHEDANLFGTSLITINGNSKLNYPTPLVQFDVSDYLLTKGARRKVSEPPQFKQAVLQTPLMLKNTFKVPIKLRGIVNNNPELRVMIENHNGNHYNHGVVIQPGETIKYAQVELQTQVLKISQGNKYISVIVNNTLIPVAIGIFDRGLICAWEEQENVISLEDIPLCTNGHEVNFDYVATNEIKIKKLKITNVNPVNMTIEQVSKQQLDDLNIFIEAVVDKNGNLIQVPTNDGETMQNILGQKRTKRLINFVIQPYQTMLLSFQIIAKENKQKFSRVDFQMKQGSSKDFSFNYKYHVISGQLTLVPQVIKFNPTFPGLPQQKSLVFRSTFDVPITVKSISSTDRKIMPILHNMVIKPNNKTEFGALSFDPSQQTTVAFQTNAQLNINNIDIASMLTQQLGHIDPATRQNIMNIMQGFTNNVVGQQSQATPTPQIAMIHLPKGVGSQDLPHNYQLQALFTPQDIENYREKQKMWDLQGFKEGKAGEITSYVVIETNVLQNLTIPIRAQVRRPSLTETKAKDDGNEEAISAEPIDFDIVQVGTAQSRNLKVMNPTDDPMTFALFITSQENYARIYKPQLKSSRNKPPQPTDKDYHFRTFCGPKLTYSSTEKFWYPDTNLDQNQDPTTVCHKVQGILDRIVKQNQTDDIVNMRRKLEDYFKDLQMLQIQREFIQKQASDQRIKIGQINAQGRTTLIEQSGSQSHYSHSVGAGTSKEDYDVIFYDKELENITNTINQHSHARPLDLQTLKILRENYDKQKALFAEIASRQGGGGGSGSLSFSKIIKMIPEFYNLMSGAFSVFKTVMLARNNPPGLKIPLNQTQIKLEKQKKKEFKLPPNHFKLYNQVLNDLIVKNDTSKLFKEIIKLTDPFIVTYTGQSFFINPKCQGQVYRVEPRSNLTIKDAVIFQPQSLFQTKMEMKLILKNNLTFIHAINLKGRSGTGFLEVTKILKKAPAISGLSSEHYINAMTLSGQIYGHGSTSFQGPSHDQTVTFKGQKISLENMTADTQRILYNVYGIGREDNSLSNLHHREMLMRANYRYGTTAGNAAATAAALMLNSEMSDPTALPFHIGQEDILIPNDKEQRAVGVNGSQPAAAAEGREQEETEYEEENEYVIINRILERASQNGAFLESEIYQKGQIKVQTYHKRVLVLQNTGNLPLTVDNLSLEDQGCQTPTFLIENCEPFTLPPGGTHWLHLAYQTDYTLAKVRKRLVLKTKEDVVQEYTLEVNMPVEHLKLANELMPLSQYEQVQGYVVKVALMAVTLTIVGFVGVEVFSHHRYSKQLVPEHEEKVLALEDQQSIQSQNGNGVFNTNSSGAIRQGTKRQDFLPPVLKSHLSHDQVYQLYLQAQDKLFDRLGPSSSGGPRTPLNQQVLLKEVANICSNKRTLVCLEAQKQALDFEKEQRRAQQMRNQIYAQQARQEKERLEQEAQRQSNRVPPESADKRPAQVVSSQKQEASSLASDTSMNDSQLNVHQEHLINTTEDAKNAAMSDQKAAAAAAAAKVPKISKKLKRDLEKKLKEQQDAEERFRLQQIEKQKREALEIQIAKELELRRQQEEIKRQQERLRQEQLERELEVQRQQQRERQQREKEAAEAELRRQQQLAQKVQPLSQRQEFIEQEKTEVEQNIQKEETKVPILSGQREQRNKEYGSFKDKESNSLQYSHHRVVTNTLYQSSKKFERNKFEDSSQNSQTTISLHTAQSLTQNQVLQQIQGGQGTTTSSSYRVETSFKDTQAHTTKAKQEQLTLSPGSNEIRSEEEDASQQHHREAKRGDSFFEEQDERQVNRPWKRYQREEIQQLDKKQETQSAINSTRVVQQLRQLKDDKEESSGETPNFDRRQKQVYELRKDDFLPSSKFNEYQAEVHEIRKSPSPRNIAKLTKQDLQPFFESQEDKKNEPRKQSIANSNNASPLLGSSNAPFSIFSFNPLNIFQGSASGGIQSQGQTPDTNIQKQRASQGPINSASNLVADFNYTEQPTDFDQKDFLNSNEEPQQDHYDDQEEEEDELDENEEEEDSKQADVYNLFMAANSLLARPNFVNQNSRSQSKFLPPQGFGQQKSKTKKPVVTSLNYNPNLNSKSGYNQEQRITEGSKYNSIFSMEEDASGTFEGESKNAEYIEEQKDTKQQQNQQQTLFSGSLFGDHGIFNQQNQYKTQQAQTKPVFSSYAGNINPWSNQNIGLDTSFNAQDPYSVSSLLQNQGTVGPQSALRRNQQLYQDNFASPYPPVPTSGGGHQQSKVSQYQGYSYAPPPPPGLGYRPSTQPQSLYQQYNSGLNYAGQSMTRPNTMDMKGPLNGSFGTSGQGTNKSLYVPSPSFQASNYPPPGYQYTSQNQSIHISQPSKTGPLNMPQQQQYEGSNTFSSSMTPPWGGISAQHQLTGAPPVMGPPPGFQSSLYGNGSQLYPNQGGFNYQQRTSSSFQMRDEDETDIYGDYQTERIHQRDRQGKKDQQQKSESDE